MAMSSAERMAAMRARRKAGPAWNPKEREGDDALGELARGSRKRPGVSCTHGAWALQTDDDFVAYAASFGEG